MMKLNKNKMRLSTIRKLSDRGRKEEIGYWV